MAYRSVLNLSQNSDAVDVYKDDVTIVLDANQALSVGIIGDSNISDVSADKITGEIEATRLVNAPANATFGWSNVYSAWEAGSFGSASQRFYSNRTDLFYALRLYDNPNFDQLILQGSKSGGTSILTVGENSAPSQIRLRTNELSQIAFDNANTRIEYKRSTNELDFLIDGSSKLLIETSGVTIPNLDATNLAVTTGNFTNLDATNLDATNLNVATLDVTNLSLADGSFTSPSLHFETASDSGFMFNPAISPLSTYIGLSLGGFERVRFGYTATNFSTDLNSVGTVTAPFLSGTQILATDPGNSAVAPSVDLGTGGLYRSGTNLILASGGSDCVTFASDQTVTFAQPLADENISSLSGSKLTGSVSASLVNGTLRNRIAFDNHGTFISPALSFPASGLDSGIYAVNQEVGISYKGFVRATFGATETTIPDLASTNLSVTTANIGTLNLTNPFSDDDITSLSASKLTGTITNDVAATLINFGTADGSTLNATTANIGTLNLTNPFSDDDITSLSASKLTGTVTIDVDASLVSSTYMEVNDLIFFRGFGEDAEVSIGISTGSGFVIGADNKQQVVFRGTESQFLESVILDEGIFGASEHVHGFINSSSLASIATKPGGIYSITSGSSTVDAYSRLYFKESNLNNNFGFSLVYNGGTTTDVTGTPANTFALVRQDGGFGQVFRHGRSSDICEWTSKIRFTQTGSQGAPTLQFNDTDTGFYGSANNIYWTCGGGHRGTMNNVAFTSNLPVRAQGGSAASPDFAFADDTDTGFVHLSSGEFGLVSNGVVKVEMNAAGWYPTGDDTYDLGFPGNRWQDIYTNGLVNTSDRRLKTEIEDLPVGLDFLNRLRPVQYKWRNTGDSPGVRDHYGLIAQEVAQAVADHGLDPAKFAPWVESPLYEEKIDEEGVKTKTATGETRQGLRYNEFIPILIKAVQDQSKIIAALNGELASLNGELASLEARLAIVEAL